MDVDIKKFREVPAQRKVEVTMTGEARQFEAGGQSITFVPLNIKRRHYSKVLVPPSEPYETGLNHVKTGQNRFTAR